MSEHEIVSIQFVHKFPGFISGSFGHCPVEILCNGEHALVIITEPLFTGSTSVTNLVEDISTQVYREFLSREYEPNQVHFLEHFVKDLTGKDSVAEIEMQWDSKRKCFGNPKWKFLALESLHSLRSKRLQKLNSEQDSYANANPMPYMKGGDA